MTENIQAPNFRPSRAWLYARGWTVQAAAERLGADASHLRRVLAGERESRRLLERVAALPEQQLVLRRKAAARKGEGGAGEAR